MATRTELNKEKQKELLDEEKRENRQKSIILVFKLLLFILIFSTLLFFYITYVSNAKIVVNEQRLVSKKIPDNL